MPLKQLTSFYEQAFCPFSHFSQPSLLMPLELSLPWLRAPPIAVQKYVNALLSIETGKHTIVYTKELLSMDLIKLFLGMACLLAPHSHTWLLSRHMATRMQQSILYRVLQGVQLLLL